MVYFICLYTATWTLICKYFIIAYKFRAILVNGIMRIDEQRIIRKFVLVYIFTVIFGFFYLGAWTKVDNMPDSRAILIFFVGAIAEVLVLL